MQDWKSGLPDQILLHKIRCFFSDLVEHDSLHVRLSKSHMKENTNPRGGGEVGRIWFQRKPFCSGHANASMQPYEMRPVSLVSYLSADIAHCNEKLSWVVMTVIRTASHPMFRLLLICRCSWTSDLGDHNTVGR